MYLPKKFEILFNDPLTDALKAKVVYNKMTAYLENSRQDYIGAVGEFNGAKSANDSSYEAYMRDNDNMGFGMGYKKPYSDDQLKKLQENVDATKKNFKDWKAILEFVVTTFINKAFPNENNSNTGSSQ